MKRHSQWADDDDDGEKRGNFYLLNWWVQSVSIWNLNYYLSSRSSESFIQLRVCLRQKFFKHVLPFYFANSIIYFIRFSLIIARRRMWYKCLRYSEKEISLFILFWSWHSKTWPSLWQKKRTFWLLIWLVRKFDPKSTQRFIIKSNHVRMKSEMAKSHHWRVV